MSEKITDREYFYNLGYCMGEKEFAAKVIERLKRDYADTCNSAYNDGIDDAMRVIDEMVGGSDAGK